MNKDIKDMTAREFLASKASKHFKDLCDEAGVNPSPRQWRKYKNRQGKAYRFQNK